MRTVHSTTRRPRLRWAVGTVLLLAAQNSTGAFFGGAVDAANLFRSAMQSGEIASALGMLAPEVLIYDDGREDRSRQAYAAVHLKPDLARYGAFYAETLSQDSAERGDIAWVTTRTRYLGKTADNAAQFIGTETLVLHRLASGWQIVHVHRSATVEAPAR
jgi:ketosteroid isomerase-like protein